MTTKLTGSYWNAEEKRHSSIRKKRKMGSKLNAKLESSLEKEEEEKKRSPKKKEVKKKHFLVQKRKGSIGRGKQGTTTTKGEARVIPAHSHPQSAAIQSRNKHVKTQGWLLHYCAPHRLFFPHFISAGVKFLRPYFTF